MYVGGKLCVHSVQPHLTSSQLPEDWYVPDWTVYVSLLFIALHCIHHTTWFNLGTLRSDNKWRPDKGAFLRLFWLINMFWLAEQSRRQSETCRISGASEWVTVSCIDRKWRLLWGQCIDFLAYQVWECREKSHFLSRRMPCQLSDSQQSLSVSVRGCEVNLGLLPSELPFYWPVPRGRNERNPHFLRKRKKKEKRFVFCFLWLQLFSGCYFHCIYENVQPFLLCLYCSQPHQKFPGV